MSDQKIAYILTSFPSLTETFITREVEEARSKGIKIELFSLKNPKTEELEKGGLLRMSENTHYLPYFFSLDIINSLVFFLRTKFSTIVKILSTIIRTHKKKPVLLLKTLVMIPKAFRIASVLREKKIIRIHSHWATLPTTIAWIVSELNDCSYTFTAHAWDIYKEDTMLDFKIENARCVITCTKYNKSYLLNKYPDVEPEKIYVIYHGINLKLFKLVNRKEHTKFKMLSVGRMVPKKGFDVLLRACAQLVKRGVRFYCSIVYVEGSSQNEIFKLHKDLALGDYVQFIPSMALEKLITYYNESDCFVLPSVISDSGDRDGIPNVFLEALSTGLPVISTDVSGIPEVIIDNETGLVVQPNDVSGLTSAIEKLYLDKELRRKLGLTGSKFVKDHFEITTNVDRLIKVIMQ